MVWRIHVRAYIRELYEGQPIATGIRAEAQEWESREAAMVVLRRLRRNPRLVPMVVEEGEPSPRPGWRHGEPR